MSTKDRDSPFPLLWALSTAAVWLFAFFSLAAKSPDYTGDGQFTISDVRHAAHEVTVGWIENQAAKRSCEPKSSIERFFESSECEQLLTMKWPIGLLSFAIGGALLAAVLTWLLKAWWRLID